MRGREYSVARNSSPKDFFKKYNLEYFVFIIPMVLLFTLFFIVPFFESIYYSFTNWSGISSNQKYIGLRNFSNIVFQDSDFWYSFAFTIKFTILGTVLINIASMALAYLLTSRVLFEKKLRIAFFIPNTISAVVVGIIWSFILGPLAKELAQKTGIAVLGSQWLTNPNLALLSVVFATLWGAIGWYMLIYVAGFEGIPAEFSESARLEGCNALKEFLYIKLPLIVPSLTVCIFLTLTNGLKVFDILWSMTKGGPGKATESVIMNIYNTSFNTFLYGYGIAKSLILVVIIAAVGILQVYYTKRKEVEL